MEAITVELLTIGERKILFEIYSLIKKIKRGKTDAFLTSAILVISLGIAGRLGVVGPIDKSPFPWFVFGVLAVAAGFAIPLFYLFFKPRIHLDISRLKELLEKDETIKSLHKLVEIRSLLAKFPLADLKWLSSPLLIEEDANQFLSRALTGEYW